MNKNVFLYLYPIEEYINSVFPKTPTEKDEALNKLNECIEKRYRNNNYEVVLALYPDSDIYGIIPKSEDKIIYTDILFEDATSIDKNGGKKLNFEPAYPSEELLINQLGKVDKLVVAGFHEEDCVKRVGEYALNFGIDTIVDLDLTEFFYYLYTKSYFIEDKYDPMEEYNPIRYEFFTLMNIIDPFEINSHSLRAAEKKFNRAYSSEVYGFHKIKNQVKELINQLENEEKDEELER